MIAWPCLFGYNCRSRIEPILRQVHQSITRTNGQQERTATAKRFAGVLTATSGRLLAVLWLEFPPFPSLLTLDLVTEAVFQDSEKHVRAEGRNGVIRHC